MNKEKILAPKNFCQYLGKQSSGGVVRKEAFASSLMLTPLVDCFSILVIFLLTLFSQNTETVFPMKKGLVLPSASSAIELKEAPILSIQDGTLSVGDQLIGRVEKVIQDPSRLATQLQELKQKWIVTHLGLPFSGNITIQANESVPSSTISQLMGLLPQLGYGSIQLAVISKSAVVTEKKDHGFDLSFHSRGENHNNYRKQGVEKRKEK